MFPVPVKSFRDGRAPALVHLPEHMARSVLDSAANFRAEPAVLEGPHGNRQAVVVLRTGRQVHAVILPETAHAIADQLVDAVEQIEADPARYAQKPKKPFSHSETSRRGRQPGPDVKAREIPGSRPSDRPPGEGKDRGGGVKRSGRIIRSSRRGNLPWRCTDWYLPLDPPM